MFGLMFNVLDLQSQGIGFDSWCCAFLEPFFVF